MVAAARGIALYESEEIWYLVYMKIVLFDGMVC